MGLIHLLQAVDVMPQQAAVAVDDHQRDLIEADRAIGASFRQAAWRSR